MCVPARTTCMKLYAYKSAILNLSLTIYFDGLFSNLREKNDKYLNKSFLDHSSLNFLLVSASGCCGTLPIHR